MPKEITPTTTSLESKSRKLAYDNEFREMFRENPGIIKTAIELIDRAIIDYDPVFVNNVFNMQVRYDKETNKWLREKRKFILKDEKIDYSGPEGAPITESDGWIDFHYGRNVLLAPGKQIADEKTGLEVTILGRSNRDLYGIHARRVDICEYIKISIKGQDFFVKRSFVTQNPGFTEFKNIMSAKEALRDLNFVRVVDAQLGYQNKNESWYVSKWENLESAGFTTFDTAISWDDYGEIKQERINEPENSFLGFESEQEYEEAEEKVNLIKEKLKPLHLEHDLDANLFYNHKTKTFILLDVTGGEDNTGIGNPIRKII